MGRGVGNSHLSSPASPDEDIWKPREGSYQIRRLAKPWPGSRGPRVMGRDTYGYRPQSMGDRSNARTPLPSPVERQGWLMAGKTVPQGRLMSTEWGTGTREMAFGQMPPVSFMPGIPMGTGVEVSEMR